jgi:hypothetical protein
MSAVLDSDELRRLAVRLVAISEMLEQRSELAVRRVEHSAAELDRAAQSLGASGEQSARELVDTVRQQGGAAIQKGLGDAILQCRAAFDAAEAQASRAASEWSVQRARLARGQQRLLAGAAATLVVGSLLAVVGSGWVLRERMQRLEQAHFGEDVLDATRTGAITRCGEHLCARAGVTPQRYGARGEYVVVAR